VNNVKSKILLLVFILLFVNAILIFRAGVNTLFFAVDTTDEYTPVRVTVEKLQPAPETEKEQSMIPVFSFMYKGEERTVPAPGLEPRNGQFKQGDKFTLWLHSGRGEFIWPPIASQKEIGRSQMVLSAISLLLAVLVWLFRRSGLKKE